MDKFEGYTIKVLPPTHTPTGKKLEDIEIPKCPKGSFNKRVIERSGYYE